MWNYKAKCLRVVDGDTVDLEVDMGFKTYSTHRFRLLGIDTPELRRGTEEQKVAGRAAAKRVRELLFPDGDEGSLSHPLVIFTEKSDSFGRWLAEIFIGNEVNSLGQILLDEGHAVPYRKR